MRANFDEIHALFSSKFVENSSKIRWKFRTLDMRNFTGVFSGFEKSEKQNFEEVKYQRKFALKGTKYQRIFEQAKYQ